MANGKIKNSANYAGGFAQASAAEQRLLVAANRATVVGFPDSLGFRKESAVPSPSIVRSFKSSGQLTSTNTSRPAGGADAATLRPCYRRYMG